MIRVMRLGEPRVLAERRARWQATYDQKRARTPGARPESRQYAHPEVIDTLRAMSHGKCFYCEGLGTSVDHHVEMGAAPLEQQMSLSSGLRAAKGRGLGSPEAAWRPGRGRIATVPEEPHPVEIAERGDLAFTWTNLYLACDHCQKKVPNTSIPVGACVDPCDADTDPADHLEFVGELISHRTPKGEETIKKYRLKQLDNERRRHLQRFTEELIEIGKTKPWPEMSAVERERLRRHAREDAPFSMMFRAFLDRHGLLRDG